MQIQHGQQGAGVEEVWTIHSIIYRSSQCLSSLCRCIPPRELDWQRGLRQSKLQAARCPRCSTRGGVCGAPGKHPAAARASADAGAWTRYQSESHTIGIYLSCSISVMELSILDARLPGLRSTAEEVRNTELKPRCNRFLKSLMRCQLDLSCHQHREGPAKVPSGIASSWPSSR
jgi:hypothetical protein